MSGTLIQLFPKEYRAFYANLCRREAWLEEIRMRVDKPLIVLSGEEFFVDEQGSFTRERRRAHVVREEELKAFVSHVCQYSLYAFEEELRQGFLTVAGGHRVGVMGQVVLEPGEREVVRTIKHIAYVNIRVAHQMTGVADPVLPYLYDRGSLCNTLIISPPGCGKTTLLRDLIRQISDGNAYGAGMRVGVVDERSEIAGTYLGHAQNDVGIRTDVLDACPKAVGIMLLLRSMSPQVIAVDELGSEQDMKALQVAASSGSKILATVHGEDQEDYFGKFGQWEGHGRGMFDLILRLGRKDGKPAILEITRREKKDAANVGCGNDHDRMLRSGTAV